MKYPYRSNVRKVIREYISTNDIKSFFQSRGILIVAFNKNDISNIGSSFYLSKKDFNEIKERMDTKTNYKKSGRINLPSLQIESFENAVSRLSCKNIGDEENTNIKITKDNSTDSKFTINIDYTEYMPGKIELLDKVNKSIGITVNEHEDGNYSLDFSHSSASEYRKIKNVLELIREQDSDINFLFEEISLLNLSFEERIDYFDSFFKLDLESWKIIEIIKLKVKLDTDEGKELTDHELIGINSAVLSGQHLRENALVRRTINNGFYFSMAKIRLDHKDSSDFIDLSIDFKTNNEVCEVSIVNSGQYIDEDDETKEIKKMMESLEQDKWLFYFQDVLNKLFQDIINKRSEPEVLFEKAQ